MKKILCTLLLCLIFCLLYLWNDVKAGVITGEKPLGGFSYLLDCAYKRELPKEPYRTMLYELLVKHHYIYEATEEEKEILYRIVEAEATDGTVRQKMNVASCIMARVESDEFPDTIKGVVFEKYKDTWQFTPLGDGRYYSVKITEDTKDAVNKVLESGRTHSCLWFCSDKSYTSGHSWHKKNLDYGFFDDMHHYFY